MSLGLSRPTATRKPERRRARGDLSTTLEVLEDRMLLADGINPQAGPPISGTVGVPINHALVASFAVTDPSGAPGTKWNAQVQWGDGARDKNLTPTANGPANNFQFFDSHTYTAPGTYNITVMIAVPQSHLPRDNVVTTTAVIKSPGPPPPPPPPPANNGSISGVVFNDLNRDHVRDNGEPGLPGWTVQLQNGAATVASTLSGSDGGYILANVAPGSYTVAQVLMPGYVQTAPPPPGTFAVTVTAGQAVSGKSFGDVLASGPTPPGRLPRFEAAGVGILAKLDKTFNTNVAFFNEPTTHRTQDFHAQIDWGDGSKPSRGHIHGRGNGRYSVIGMHRYVKPGLITATITIRDPHGRKVQATTLIHVQHP